MDEHNVHQLWGLSPAVDLLSVSTTASEANASDLKILQVCPYDCRHVLQTICHAPRHPELSERTVQLYTYEEQPDLLARHMLLISIVLDDDLPVRERMELFLEVHGNVLLRAKTAAYVDARSRRLEALVDEIVSKGTATTPLGKLFDLSLLRYQELDGIVEALQSYRTQAAYDAVKGWDARARRWYADRYDFRRNLVDWDYHMRLILLGLVGGDPAEQGSIIHFYHFRHWRMHGVAYELRDSEYDQPNRTMITTAVGRTKEFKDRNGKDIGRKVSARGFWGDIINPPYYSFGITSEDQRFFVMTNKQLSHTAVDVAEHNLQALMEELRTGEPYNLPSGKEHRAKAARGPTSLDELAAATSSAAVEEVSDDANNTAKLPIITEGVADAPGDGNNETVTATTSEQAAAEAELNAKEDALNAAVWKRCQHFKVVLVTGDLVKQLTGKQKFREQFSLATVGHRHMHLLGSEHRLQQVVKPGGRAMAETAKYMLQLSKEQASKFQEKMVQVADEGGWQPAVDAPAGLEAQLLLKRKAA